MHRHKCDTCGHVWQHGRECAGDDAAHTCKQCGEEQWYQYKGEQSPAETSLCAMPWQLREHDERYDALAGFLAALVRF